MEPDDDDCSDISDAKPASSTPSQSRVSQVRHRRVAEADIGINTDVGNPALFDRSSPPDSGIPFDECESAGIYPSFTQILNASGALDLSVPGSAARHETNSATLTSPASQFSVFEFESIQPLVTIPFDEESADVAIIGVDVDSICVSGNDMFGVISTLLHGAAVVCFNCF